MIWIFILVGILCFISGFGLCALFIARDENMVKLGDGEVVIEKPKDGFVLVAMRAEDMRRYIAMQGSEDEAEARKLYIKPRVQKK